MNRTRPLVGVWMPVAILLADIVATALLYPRLPELVPLHWNAGGEVDRLGSRASIFVLPAVNVGTWLLLRLVPHLDPRRAGLASFRGADDLVVLAIVLVVTALHAVVLATTLGASLPVAPLVVSGVGVLFAVIGNYLPKLRSNWVAGIRTPWTLSSDVVWERTHRVGGYTFVAAGVVMAVAAWLLPAAAIPVLVVAVALGVTLFSFVYSYRVWREVGRPGRREGA